MLHYFKPGAFILPIGESTGMTTSQLPRHPEILRVGSYANAAPSCLVEYAYYALLFYGMLATFLGIFVPALAGGMMLVLAAFCILRLGPRATVVYTPLRFPLACALSYLIVQITVHGESIMGGEALSFIQWILVLIILQSLYLRRGFLHRCVLVFFSMGLIGLPYLISLVRASGRGHEVGIGFSNANSLGEWFGFCCLYFTIVGLETKRNGVRVASILAAVGCLYIVGLTVSRGALVATAIGITIALRRLLRRGFVPLLVLIIVSGSLYTFGVFDGIIGHYTERGMEETGRLLVWPLAIERFLSSPLLGVGAGNIATYVPSVHKHFTPHNSFIYIALASGVLPLALFVACVDPCGSERLLV